MNKADFVKVAGILNKKYFRREEKLEPFEVLVHGILSTRTKDTTTIPAQKRLLSVAGTPHAIEKMKTNNIEKIIYPVGFYRTKARLLKRACRTLVDLFGSEVPSNKADLMKIPGVGNKVASLVLERGFNLPYIAVDTHVNRISQRLGIVGADSRPTETEIILEGVLKPKLRLRINSSFVWFGRDICRPVSPLCGVCPVYKYCGFKFKSKYANRHQHDRSVRNKPLDKDINNHIQG